MMEQRIFYIKDSFEKMKKDSKTVEAAYLTRLLPRIRVVNKLDRNVPVFEDKDIGIYYYAKGCNDLEVEFLYCSIIEKWLFSLNDYKVTAETSISNYNGTLADTHWTLLNKQLRLSGIEIEEAISLGFNPVCVKSNLGPAIVGDRIWRNGKLITRELTDSKNYACLHALIC